MVRVSRPIGDADSRWSVRGANPDPARIGGVPGVLRGSLYVTHEIMAEKLLTTTSRLVRAVDSVIRSIVGAICLLTAGGVPLLALLAVAARHVPGVQAVWAPELIHTGTLVLVMMGATLALYRSEHVRLSLADKFINRLSPHASESLVAASMGLLGLGIIVVGIPLLESVKSQSTVILRIPLVIPYSSVLVAGVAFVLHSVARAIGAIERRVAASRSGGSGDDN